MKKGLFGVRNTCKECRKLEKEEYILRPEVKARRKKQYQETKHLMRERLNVYYWTLTSQYHQYKKSAKKHNRDFTISKEDCEIYYNSSCYYCGEEYIGLRIDRIDSSVGYVKDNLRPCCKMS